MSVTIKTYSELTVFVHYVYNSLVPKSIKFLDRGYKAAINDRKVNGDDNYNPTKLKTIDVGRVEMTFTDVDSQFTYESYPEYEELIAAIDQAQTIKFDERLNVRTFVNATGISKTHTDGMRNSELKLPYVQEVVVPQDPIPIQEAFKMLWIIKTHRFENWYEMYSPAASTVTSDQFQVNFGMGS